MSSHCPSHDWDTYNDALERQAMDSAVNEVNDLAAKLLPAILANPQQFTANMAISDMVELAYEAAAALMASREKIAAGGTRHISVPYVPDDELETWEDKFWRKHGEEILP